MSRSHKLVSLAVLVGLALAFFWWAGPRTPVDSPAPEVLTQYADIAHATFGDAQTRAVELQTAIETLLATPDEETLAAARQAWRNARVPYMQTEVFRFGNPVVDEWEGAVNAWPLDEGLIDYVAADYVHEGGNIAANANLIVDGASGSLTLGIDALDTGTINADLLTRLNEYGGSEANVATGYHAIEFLLWGQDLNGYDDGAGERPASDFATAEGRCTNGPEPAAGPQPCERRGAYLATTVAKLVEDLNEMTRQWAPDVQDNYRQTLLTLPEAEAMRRVFLGLGSLALGELAGERMKVALIANSPEDEHDCFSDNTHWSHFYNLRGIANVYHGRYETIAGKTLAGPSVQSLLEKQAPELAEQTSRALAVARGKMQTLADTAENGMRFDQMIAPGNDEGARTIRETIDALVVFAGRIEKAASALGLNDVEADTAGHSF